MDNDCKTFEQTFSTYKIWKGILDSLYHHGRCPKTCSEETFTQTEISAPNSENHTTIVMYYKGNSYDLQKEQLLYDLNSIVAAVGGSLGLFLGFSFLDFAFRVIEFVAKKLGRPA